MVYLLRFASDLWTAYKVRNFPGRRSKSTKMGSAEPRPRWFGAEDQARAQVAEFYKRWLGSLESVSPSGRSFALYQDLSNAYVLGRRFPGLPDLPDDEKTARRPERVAEQLMLQCL